MEKQKYSICVTFLIELKMAYNSKETNSNCKFSLHTVLSNFILKLLKLFCFVFSSQPLHISISHTHIV
jgi:hypothetical protein